MKHNISSKASAIIWTSVFGGLLVAIVILATISFYSNYYSPIFVNGRSMQPTLNYGLDAGKVEYGYTDTHQSAIDSIKRFDIVTPYYPWSDYPQPYQKGSKALDGKDFKIKRVYCFPGERFYIENAVFYIFDNQLNKFIKYDDDIEKIDNVQYPFTFSRLFDIKKKTDPEFNFSIYKDTPLPEDCYWVQGDHWADSSDCLDAKQPIYKENIDGVLIAIEGTATVTYDEKGKMTIKDKVPYSEPRYFKDR